MHLRRQLFLHRPCERSIAPCVLDQHTSTVILCLCFFLSPHLFSCASVSAPQFLLVRSATAFSERTRSATRDDVEPRRNCGGKCSEQVEYRSEVITRETVVSLRVGRSLSLNSVSAPPSLQLPASSPPRSFTLPSSFAPPRPHFTPPLSLFARSCVFVCASCFLPFLFISAFVSFVRLCSRSFPFSSGLWLFFTSVPHPRPPPPLPSFSPLAHFAPSLPFFCAAFCSVVVLLFFCFFLFAHGCGASLLLQSPFSPLFLSPSSVWTDFPFPVHVLSFLFDATLLLPRAPSPTCIPISLLLFLCVYSPYLISVFPRGFHFFLLVVAASRPRCAFLFSGSFIGPSSNTSTTLYSCSTSFLFSRFLRASAAQN